MLKKCCLWALPFCLVTVLLPFVVMGQKGSVYSGVTLGVRQHLDHPEYDSLPFGEGDLTYLLAYEYHEGTAYWQIGLGYTPHGSATSLLASAESVVTPQVSLLFKDKLLWGGAGLMKSYISGGDDSFWTGFYWQLQMGIHLPLSGKMDLQAGAYYLFDDWSDVGHLDMDQVELGLSLSYFF